MQLSQSGQYDASLRTSWNAPPGAKLPICPESTIVYRKSEKYSLPVTPFQYPNSICSPALAMIGTENPDWMWKETPRTIPSSTPKEAIWSQKFALSDGPVSTGWPIWTPSSIGTAGTIDATPEKRLTSPITHRGGQSSGNELGGRSTPRGSHFWLRGSRKMGPWSTGSHCGGHATGCSTSAGLLATPGLVMC